MLNEVYIFVTNARLSRRVETRGARAQDTLTMHATSRDSH
jgi:hypothetical protein